MRVLLTHHFPLKQTETGWLVWHWAEALGAAGHEVRVLVVDEEHRFGEPLAVERVVCGDDPNADLTFKLPRFSAERGVEDRPLFLSLSMEHLARYRECLRRRLDAVILHFNPHVIHVQHIWVLGQLALETGVPYVVSAWPAELVDCQSDKRYRALAEQAAENAGRILAADRATMRRIVLLYKSAGDRTMLMSPALNLRGPTVSRAAGAAAADALHAIYQGVLDKRFG